MSRKWVGPILIGLAFIGTALLYPRLPERIPTHWDWRGQVDATSPRFPGAFLVPLIMTAVWLLLPLLRRIDPRRRNYERFDETFWVLLNVLALGTLLLQGAVLATALGSPVEPGRLVLGAVGILFLVIGNYLPRLRSNWWMGIRTPWTLDSEEVWRRTHRLGGWTFAAGGIATLLAVLLLPLQAASVASMVALGIAALVPVVFSFVAWRQQRERAS